MYFFYYCTAHVKCKVLLIPPNADNRSLVDLIFCVQTSAHTTGRLFYYCHLILCVCFYVVCSRLLAKTAWREPGILSWKLGVITLRMPACLSVTTLSWKQAGDRYEIFGPDLAGQLSTWLTFPANELLSQMCTVSFNVTEKVRAVWGICCSLWCVFIFVWRVASHITTTTTTTTRKRQTCKKERPNVLYCNLF